MANEAISHRLKSYNQKETSAFVQLLCEGYQLEGNFTLNDICQHIRELRSKHPSNILLATLDDYEQSAYTCGHSIDSHDLDSIISHDLSKLPATVFEEYQGKVEHIGHLTLTDEFPIRYNNFMKEAEQIDIANIRNSLEWDMIGDSKSIMTSDHVEFLPLENNSFIQIVPVKQSPEAIAAYPNGYFEDDLNPFQNYILSKQILDRFGFDLFGIGATYLGFMRDKMISKNEASQIGLFLEDIYFGYEGNKPLHNIIANQLEGKREFYIAYAQI